MRTRPLIAIVALGPIVAIGCSSAPPPSESEGTTSSAITGPFVKHGDNGTVDCNTYCEGSQWGQIGSCLGSEIDNLPCNQETGLLTNGVEQICWCSAGGQTFVKNGDNGTASCATFCAGSQWGRVGTCVGAALQTNASVSVGGTQVSYDNACSIRPGVIDNGTEMTCVCQAQAACRPYTCSHYNGECGSLPSGCGGTLNCGCGAGKTCQGSVCVPSSQGGSGWPCQYNSQCLSDVCQNGLCTGSGGSSGGGGGGQPCGPSEQLCPDGTCNYIGCCS